jgi:hypothetical protein
MLEHILLADQLLKCLGPCHEFEFGGGRWEYTIGDRWPSPLDLESDRLYVQFTSPNSIVSNDSIRATFRLSVYGGVGSVGQLVAADLECKLSDCLGCLYQGFSTNSGTIPYPSRNSDRTIPVTTMLLSVVI